MTAMYSLQTLPSFMVTKEHHTEQSRVCRSQRDLLGSLTEELSDSRKEGMNCASIFEHVEEAEV